MKHLISILGPTGIGKTSLSIDLALAYGAPVISADSVQIYKHLDIGSAKITEEEMCGVPHYMIDVLEPCAHFSSGTFGREVDKLLERLFRNHDQVILAGGSGFYFQAVWEGLNDMPDIPARLREELDRQFRTEGLEPLLRELEVADPATWAEIDRQNPARVIRALEVFRASGRPISEWRQGTDKEKAYRDIKLGLDMDRAELYERIHQRVDAMMEAGLLEEVRALWKQYGPGCKGLGAVGYREMVAYLEGEHELERAIELLKRNSTRYAKRQLTWFRRYEDITWFHPGEGEAIRSFVAAQLAQD